MKRICLFAGYDKQNIIDDYVVYFVQALSEFSDVFYFADNDLPPEELDKLKGIAKLTFGRKHGRYDFGSWAELIKHIGHAKLAEYDQVLLVNDSSFAPMFPLKEMFEKMDAQDLDAWSICGNRFMMSFFMALDRKVVAIEGFREFFDNIKPEADKSVVIKKYERGINNLVTENGFKWGVYIDGKDVKKFFNKNKSSVWQKIQAKVPMWALVFIKFAPNKVRLYEDDFILPFFMRMPLMKKMSFLVEENITPCIALDLIRENSDYPVELIENYFKRIGVTIDREIKDVVWKRVVRKLKNFVWDKKYRGNRFIIRVFTIPVYVKKMDYTVNNS